MPSLLLLLFSLLSSCSWIFKFFSIINRGKWSSWFSTLISSSFFLLFARSLSPLIFSCSPHFFFILPIRSHFPIHGWLCFLLVRDEWGWGTPPEQVGDEEEEKEKRNRKFTCFSIPMMREYRRRRMTMITRLQQTRIFPQIFLLHTAVIQSLKGHSFFVRCVEMR